MSKKEKILFKKLNLGERGVYLRVWMAVSDVNETATLHSNSAWILITTSHRSLKFSQIGSYVLVHDRRHIALIGCDGPLRVNVEEPWIHSLQPPYTQWLGLTL